MAKAKKVAIFVGSVMAVVAFSPIIAAGLDRLTGGAFGNVVSSLQTTAASTLGVAGGVEAGAGGRIIAD